MTIIYVLQKDVPGLGRLTKIGMTVRSGEDRANEYGGGGWDVVDEISVAVEDVAELKDLEGRIHDRLRACRCHSAVAFGLTEVFTCTADEAVAAARAEIGSKATDEDRIARLRKRTARTVERKVLQRHAADLAKLHMGKFNKISRIELHKQGEVPWRASVADVNLWRIHTTALNALDAIGAEATTFREMVGADLSKLREKWAAEEEDRLWKEGLKGLEENLVRVRAAREQERTQTEEAEKKRLADRLSAFDRVFQQKKSRANFLQTIAIACVASAVILGSLVLVEWAASGTNGVLKTSVVVVVALLAAGGVAFSESRKVEQAIAKLREDWNSEQAIDV